MSYRFVAGLGADAIDLNALINAAAQVGTAAVSKPPKAAANVTYVTNPQTGQVVAKAGISPWTWGILGLAGVGVLLIGGKLLHSRYSGRVRRNPGRKSKARKSRRSRSRRR